MDFRILGPVEVWSGGRKLQIKRAQERLVLAILLQTPNVLVSTEKLLDHVWDGGAPQKARDSLNTLVSRLRGRLSDLDGNVSIETVRGRGYVLRVDEQRIDLFQFRTLRRKARAMSESSDDREALERIQEALDLHRGEPLADLTGDWAERVRRTHDDERFGARVERIEVMARLGHHADLVPELSELIAERPGNQKLVAHLMTALYRSGRQGEALTVYHDAAHRLRGLYGTDPDKELQELQARILSGDRGLLPAERIQAAAAPIPRSTLPDDIPHFTGRDEEVAALLAMASPTQPEQTAHATVIAIDGMPGVGKTVLAVHVAHRLADEYPHGQIYLNLHGVGGRALQPGDALEALLETLGVAARRIPRSVEGRAALLRSELVSRRVLVVLDNATGHQQIRPLLSGAPGCLTVVTSRRHLVGLDDVRSLSLEVLPPADAGRLLELAVGSDRSTPRDDLAEVVRLCGFLPLAIRLVANRMRHRPARTAADLARRLSERPLAEIRAEDREITAAFKVSYLGLKPGARHAFRRLGLHLGPDFTLYGAAAALGWGIADTDRAIEELLDNSLLGEPTEGRYRFHSLLRVYARELADTEVSATERDDVVRRQIEYYVSTALLADRLIDVPRAQMSTGLVPPPNPPPVETADEAREWLDAEYQSLLIIADHTTEPILVGLLSHGLARYMEMGGHWDKAAELHERAIDAWRELADPGGEAQALFDLSVVCFRTGQYDEALQHAENSFRIRRSLGDERGKADVLDHRGLIEWQQSRYRDALGSMRWALRIWHALGDRRGEAQVLDHIAIVLEFLGRYQEAADRRGSALEIHAEIDDPQGLMRSLNNQGDLMLRLGRVSDARGCYEDAEAVAAEMPRQHKAIWHNNMARIDRHEGRNTEALNGFRYALSTYRQIGDRRSEIETLIEIGVTYFRMGKHQEALIHYERAYARSREIAEFFQQTKALRRIGDVLLAEGRVQEALEYLHKSIDLADMTKEPYERARALDGIGTIYLRTRGRGQARKCWKQALKFYERARMTSEAERVRALLENRPPRTDA